MSALIQAVKENVGQIVKTIALVILILCILGSIAGAIILFSNAKETDYSWYYGYESRVNSAYVWLGILVLIFGPVTSFVPFAFAYAFGELVENSTIIAKRGGTGRPGVVNHPDPQNRGSAFSPAPQSGGSAYGYAPQNRGSAFGPSRQSGGSANSPAPQNGGNSYRPAPSDDTYRVGGFQFKKEDGYSVIIGVTGTPQGVLSVPAAMGGSDVTAMGNFAFSKCTDIKRVEIPNSVKRIGGSAFSGCTGLDSVSIPESVESIGSEIFSGCASLKEIKVKEGSYAQKWCADNGFSDKIVTY